MEHLNKKHTWEHIFIEFGCSSAAVSTASHSVPLTVGESGSLQDIFVRRFTALSSFFLLFFCFQEPTAIPSRKKTGGGCARGWCVRRGSLM